VIVSMRIIFVFPVSIGVEREPYLFRPVQLVCDDLALHARPCVLRACRQLAMVLDPA
jgi:hypothetical protein